MKHKLLTASAAVPVALILTWGSIFCMVTGLNLPVDDVGRLLLMWLFCALAGCLLFSFPSGALLATAGIAALGFWLWNTRGITVPIRALITRLSTIYNNAYGWGVLEFTGVNWETTSLDMLLGSWGCLITLSATAAVVRGRGSIPAVLLALPPLISTMVVTDTPPDVAPLGGLLLAVTLILMTASVSRQSPIQAAKLAAIAAVPTALVLGSIFLLFPKDSYVSHADAQLSSIVSWWQTTIVSPFKGGGLGQDFTPTPTASASTRLGSLGPRRVVPYPVMDVTADFDGVLYLRGQDYDKYDGQSWTSTTDRTEELPKGSNAALRGVVSITTRNPLALTYLPSYPNRDHTLTDGRIENTGELTEFFWSVSKFSDLPSHFSSMYDEWPGLVAYQDLPQSTFEWAEDYVRQVLEDGGLYEDPLVRSLNAAKAQIIIDHVGNSARYSLTPQRMDDDYDDFAQWFLEESDEGYCVHFATAAAVLLRAAGVPARYVTGYVVTCEADKTITVASDRAHAWVEYYDEVYHAWIIAEPTPPDFQDEVPETEPVTGSPVTQPLTEPNEKETTTPTKPTQDSEKSDWTHLTTALRWAALAAALLAAVIIQRAVRLMLRRRTILGNTNHRALVLWHDVEQVSTVLRQDPPAELLALAQKAKFSQHDLMKDELLRFTDWLDNARTELDRRPFFIRLWCRYVLALW